MEYTYTYDANGNIVSDSLGGTLKHSYVYDEAGQLVRVNDAVQNKTFCYTYDNGGNLIYKKRYAYTTGTLGSVLQTMGTYAYGDSNWKDKLTSYNNISLSYDAIGNLTNFDDRSFTWTAGRQLAGFELYTDDYAVSYKYNADGLRTQKYIDDDQTYTDTTYDYIWADGKLVSQTDGTDVLYFLYDSNDSPTGFVLNDAATYLYIKNLQGDITGIADENGAIIVNYTYDEWGKLLSLTDNSLDGIIGELNPLRYRGYYYDTETGYYYLQSRYYNPSWGRFINADVYVDTGKFSMGSNMFAYCENNSINMSDPSGFWGGDVHYGREYNAITGRSGRTNYDGTYEWAIKTGFTKKDYANIIANECVLVDNFVLRSTMSWAAILTTQGYHFNVAGTGQPDSRIKISNELFSEAVNKFLSAKTNIGKKDALQKLGRGLHPLQDFYAHGDFGVGGFLNKVWKSHGSHYDDVYYDWANDKVGYRTSFSAKRSSPGSRYKNTESASLNYLQSFIIYVGKSSVA